MADDAKAVATPEVAQIAAAVTAVIGVFTGLAVTGAFADTQRNHGDAIFIAFACVLFGAVLWFTAVVIPPRSPRRFRIWIATWAYRKYKGRGRRQIRRNTGRVKLVTLRWLLQVFGVLAFAAGIALGLYALVKTQGESERPSVTASFKNSVLTGTAAADGLGSSQAVRVRVQGISERVKGNRITLVADRHDLYYALVGPDSDGKVSHTFAVPIPTKYNLVGVKVWSGGQDQGCQIYENIPSGKNERGYPAGGAIKSHFRASDEDGCLVLRLSNRANTKQRTKTTTRARAARPETEN